MEDEIRKDESAPNVANVSDSVVFIPVFAISVENRGEWPTSRFIPFNIELEKGKITTDWINTLRIIRNFNKIPKNNRRIEEIKDRVNKSITFSMQG